MDSLRLALSQQDYLFGRYEWACLQPVEVDVAGQVRRVKNDAVMACVPVTIYQAHHFSTPDIIHHQIHQPLYMH